MAKLESLGIKGLESVHWYVHDLERSRRFYVDGLDFAEQGVSSPELEQKGKQKSAVFQAGNVVLVVSQPVGEGGRAWRYLRKHPDGVGTLNYQVEDIEKTCDEIVVLNEGRVAAQQPVVARPAGGPVSLRVTGDMGAFAALLAAREIGVHPDQRGELPREQRGQRFPPAHRRQQRLPSG